MLDPNHTRQKRHTSSEYPPFIVHNPQAVPATLAFLPLELDPTFPLEVILDGERDDRAITQLHIHDGLEIGYCLEGSGTLHVGSKILPFHAGVVTIITDHEYHRSRSNPGTTSRWTWFFLNPPRLLVPHATPQLAWEPERFSGPQFKNVLTQAEYPAIIQLVLQLISEAQQDDTLVRTNLRALCLVLLNALHRAFPRRTAGLKIDHSARALARIAPALQLITSRFDEVLTVPELASACAMGVRNFQLQFTNLMGCSPLAHLLQCRIQAATALLHDNNRTITEIALSCGFNTISSFNRAFQAIQNTSPREYRRKNRQ